MPTAALVLISLFLGVYGWTTAIECGIGMLRLLPSNSLTRHSLRFFAPKWELTNIFLALTFAGFAIFFNRGLVDVRKTLSISLVVGLVALLVRILFQVYLYRSKKSAGLHGLNLLFAAVCFLVPLSFGAAGIHLLTGMSFWQSTTGWWMIVCLGLGLLALSLSWIYYEVGQTPHGRLPLLSRALNLLFFAETTIILQLSVSRHYQHLLTLPFIYFMILVAFGGVWLAGLWYSARERYMWWYLSIIAIAAPLLLALANRPFLLFPISTTSQSLGSQSYLEEIIIGVAVLLPIIFLAFGITVWLRISGTIKKSRSYKAKSIWGGVWPK